MIFNTSTSFHPPSLLLAMDELEELEWRSPEWINVHGLRTENVLEYFSGSPFWDRQCNNQQLKMQRGGQTPVPTVDAELERLRGVEYAVKLVREPDLWVVQQQWRESGGNNGGNGSGVTTRPLSHFYIVGARVYMAPRAAGVLRGNCLAAAEALHAFLPLLEREGQRESGEIGGDPGGESGGESGGEDSPLPRALVSLAAASIDP